MTLTVITPGRFTAPGLPDLGALGFTDTFSRGDATTLGRTEAPRRNWALSGDAATGGITDGTAYLHNTTSNYLRQVALVEAYTGDAVAELTLSHLDTANAVHQFGLVFRGASIQSCWTFQAHGLTQYRLSTLVGNSQTDVQRIDQVPQVGDVLRVEADGTQIRAFVNGVEVAQTTSDAMVGQTMFGLYSNMSTPTSRASRISVAPL